MRGSGRGGTRGQEGQRGTIYPREQHECRSREREPGTGSDRDILRMSKIYDQCSQRLVLRPRFPPSGTSAICGIFSLCRGVGDPR